MGFLVDESYKEEEDRTKWRQDPAPVIGEIHIADGSDIHRIPGTQVTFQFGAARIWYIADHREGVVTRFQDRESRGVDHNGYGASVDCRLRENPSRPWIAVGSHGGPRNTINGVYAHDRSAALMAGTDIMTGHLFTNGELIATRSAGTRDRRMKGTPAVTHLQFHAHLRRGLAVWRGAQQALFRELHTPAGA